MEIHGTGLANQGFDSPRLQIANAGNAEIERDRRERKKRFSDFGIAGRVALISPIASGKEGWGTPTGRHRIIHKDPNHISADFGLVVDAYGGIVNPNATPRSPVPRGSHYMPAPMPDYMQFGRYFGMHAGYLPGYPASHGCVRMPRDLAAEFFARVQVGTPVVVIGSARNVTRVRRAIPVVQSGESGNKISFYGSRAKPQRRFGFW